MCTNSINPKKIDSDTYSIIFEPYSVGEMLSFVVASNFNFKTFKEKKSCFSNRYKEKISMEEFNLTDNPHIPEGIGTKSIDDEGIKTEKNKLIENGFLQMFFLIYMTVTKKGKKIIRKCNTNRVTHGKKCRTNSNFSPT